MNKSDKNTCPFCGSELVEGKLYCTTICCFFREDIKQVRYFSDKNVRDNGGIIIHPHVPFPTEDEDEYVPAMACRACERLYIDTKEKND